MSRGSILLADDNKLVVKITSAILEDADYEVSVAWDGLEAINKAYAEDPDLIILDVEMPKINGYQVCRLLRDDLYTRDTPIIMLTGRDAQSDMFWGIKTGADAYMTKGFKPEQFLAVVEEQVGIGKAVREEQAERSIPPQLLGESGVLSRVIDLLDSRLFESVILNELGSLASVNEDYRETIRAVLDILARVIGNTAGYVLFPEQNDVIVDLRKQVSDEALEKMKLKVLEIAGEYGWVNLEEEPVSFIMYGDYNIVPQDCGPDGEERPYYYVHIPLMAQKALIGVLVLAHKNQNPFLRHAREILEIVKTQVTIVIDNARLYEATRKLAITDGLTKIYNHRFFQDLFEKEFTRSIRYNTVFSLAIVDIDHFKRINDTYGHLCGDKVLKTLAALLKNCLRTMDVVARYGGEEFAIILPETGPDDAFLTVDRIREMVAAREFECVEPGQMLNLTVSIGVTSFPSPEVTERSELIAKADKALYEAKETGRNRTVFYR